ncbi:MAG TPA: hypothetical protein VMU92_13145 [Acidobacteriaceae bacterium]|nr:hypothetical protein [Acidobacteriaceae bacterium]
MPEQGSRARLNVRWPTVGVGFLVALPAILFYSILFSRLINIPFADDYLETLRFSNQIKVLHGTKSILSFLFSFQYNEYKLLFENAIFAVQVLVFKSINFRVLSALGDLFVLFLALLLWKMFFPQEGSTIRRLIYFVPVTWFVFQMQYVETLNWSMASLQNLPVIFFSLTTIYLLVTETGRGYLFAAICLVLSICSSGNGFVMIPLGVLILVNQRRRGRLIIWACTSLICIAAYFYRYNFNAKFQAEPSLFKRVAHINPLFIFIFLGNAINMPIKQISLSHADFHSLEFLAILSPVLGAVLCIFWVNKIRKGYLRKNPLIAYCVLFVLITAIGAAGIRSGMSVWEATSSRYGIYSALLLIFTWFTFSEEFLLRRNQGIGGRRWLLIGVIAMAMCYGVITDAFGCHYLTARNRELVRGMVAYQEPNAANSGMGPVVPLKKEAKWHVTLREEAPSILEASKRLGVYTPRRF